jgi:hypothetical protein
MKKQALNNIKQKGFDSKAQMRYLLFLARKYPDKYKFVFDVLREHGVPSKEKEENAYWEAPYKVSPDTPSYRYKGKRKSAMSIEQKLMKIADFFDESDSSSASKINKILHRRTTIDYDLARTVANAFWAMYKNEISKDPEQMYRWFLKLHAFETFKQLNSETKQETERMLSDRLMGRQL